MFKKQTKDDDPSYHETMEKERVKDGQQQRTIPLAMQSRTQSINDAATALGMLANGGINAFHNLHAT
jgi:D-alanyl-D-alanine carboxypeptidase